jgi:hypothetical protein
VPTKKSVLLGSVEVAAVDDTLLSNDVGTCLAPPESPLMSASRAALQLELAGLASMICTDIL